MRIILVFVLPLVGFATGAVITRLSNRTRATSPVHPIELVTVVLGLILIGELRPAHYMTGYGVICAAAMVVLGMLVARAACPANRFVLAGTREFETHDEGAPTAWKRYLRFSRAVVDYEFRLLLVATYLLLVAPIAIAARFGRSSVSQYNDSNWLRRNEAVTLESAKRSF